MKAIYRFTLICTYFVLMLSQLYAATDPISFKNGDSLFVVNNITSLLTDKTKQDELFNFLKNEDIHHIFFAARVKSSSNPLLVSTNYLEDSKRAPLQAFISRAHQANVSVIYYDGNEQWLKFDNHHLAVASIEQFISYNLEVAANERFDGIHFDIIPGKLGVAEWRSNTGRGKDRYNDQLEASYIWIVSTGRELLKAANLDSLTVSCGINYDYSYYVKDLIEPLFGPNSPADVIVIRNTIQSKDQVITGINNIGGVENNLALANSVPLLFIFDVLPQQEESFIRPILDEVKKRFSSNPLYLGLGFYDYSIYKTIASNSPDTGGQPTGLHKRSLWIWDGSRELILNNEVQQAFFNFLKAPHGNPNVRVTRLYYYGNAYHRASKSLRAEYVVALRNFINKATQNGVQVEYLDGDPQWALDQYKQIPIDLCQAVLNYNLSVNPEERFSGVHLDIEPHALGDIWEQNTSNGKDNYNDTLENNLLSVYRVCREKINQSGIPFTLSGDFNTKWAQRVTDVMDILMASNSPLDYITIMNYYSTYEKFARGSGGVGGIENNLSRTQIPLVFGAETDIPNADPITISFYELGNAALEKVFQRVEEEYKDHPFFGGVAIHHWKSYYNLKP